MTWDDERLRAQLDDLAHDAADLARPLPAAEVRRSGQLRRRRRHAGLTAMVLAVLLIVGSVTAGALRGLGSGDGPPPVAAVPTPTAPSTPTTPSTPSTPSTRAASLTVNDLPPATDLRWNEAVTFSADDTAEGDQRFQPSVCYQASTTEQDPIARVFRTYHATNADKLTASVELIEFASADRAARVESMLRSWAKDCGTTAGRQHPGARVTDVYPVDVSNGTAHFVEVSYSITGSDLGAFDSFGWYRTGRRIAIVTFNSTGYDHNYDVKPGGPVGVLHPMVLTLPRVADRLN